MITLATADLSVQNNADLMQAVLNEVGACIYVKDLEGRYQYANKLTLQAFRCQESDLIDQADEAFFDEASVSLLRQNDRKVLEQRRSVTGEEIVRFNAGDIRTYQFVKSPILNIVGEVVGIFGVSTDITELYQLKEELRVQATTDALTGVFNRRCFFEMAEREFSKARRHKLDLSLMVLDLDHFKQVNDSYGHVAGDEVLAYVANFIESALRREDIVARIGGEEFAVLLPNTAQAQAAELAERLRGRLSDQSIQGSWDGGLHVQTSVGVAGLQMLDCSFSKLYMRGDVALYQAKNAGRNQVGLA